jgi:uncharacterized protein (UPF0276 family)
MKLAVHYTPQLVELLHQGEVEVDYFKCPAWPQLIPEAKVVRPTYIHFPLSVGKGIQSAYDTGANQAVDWTKVDRLLTETDTPYINLHLTILADDYPSLARDTVWNDLLVENTLKDIEAAIAQYGRERVIIENDHSFGGAYLPITYQPNFVRTVVEASGCGFLLDLSHARLAASYLSMDTHEYIELLPVQALREVHVSGVRLISDVWVTEVQAKLQNTDVSPQVVERYRGHLLDHQPMTIDDWSLLEWALDKIETGSWNKPWIIASEYSGVGALWQAVTDIEVLRQQVPRLWQLTHSLKAA